MNKSTTLSEAQLVNQIATPLANLIGVSGGLPQIHREVAVGGSVADLIYIVTSWDGIPSTIEPLTTHECVVLSVLRRRGATRIDLLEKRCGLSSGSLRPGVLKRLIDLGFVEKGKGGRVSSTETLEFKYRIIAIEAKLVKWKRALQQATAYRKYADEVFVLLPEEAALRAFQEFDSFRETGVGLLAVKDCKVDTFIHAITNSDHDWRREFVLSRMLSTI